MNRAKLKSAISIAAFDELIRRELPFAAESGIKVEKLEAGAARVRLPVHGRLLRPGGTISGPAMMGLADFTMYAVVMSRLGPAKHVVTTNLNANFLRRPAPVDLIAEGRLIKLGKRLAYGEVTLYSEGDDEPVCHVTSTYSIPPQDGSTGAS
ncbi:MAG: PaaI family thioesterase [Proteobacteria bacterium]|nr:PaaI family thioesterase [Pseudomonadota bacterium]MBI3497354.1 PaaI family thioesterase [Pseudomonadota bacterium]